MHNRHEAQLISIQQHVERHLSQHNYESAVFLADKLLTMTKNMHRTQSEIHESVFLLAKCFWSKGERRRACRLVLMQGNPTGIREKFLAAKCMEEVGDWNECLNILGEEDKFIHFLNTITEHDHYAASLCYIRAKCLEVLEKKEKAAEWYIETLKRDPSFTQAYDKLIDGFMLREDQEEELLNQIQFESCDEWIRSFYEIKMQKYEQESQKQKEDNLNILATSCYLQNNADIMTQYAALYFSKREYQRVYNITQVVVDQDPYHLPLLPIHILTLLYLQKKTQLFYHAHKLAEEGSFGSKTASLANFASACYYYVCGRWDTARKYFVKSSSMDGKFLPALLGVGHSLSNNNDPDLALASYRSTTRIFSKSPFPYIYQAMEHMKSNELDLAEPLIAEAMKLKNCVEAWNELGVIQLKKGLHEESIQSLSIAVSMCPSSEYDNEIDPSFEYILFNLATAHRKARNYVEAYNFYLRCMRLNSEDPSVYAALGLTCHLQANLHDAIEWYHKSMAFSRDGDNFSATMLAKALNQLSEQPSDYLINEM